MDADFLFYMKSYPIDGSIIIAFVIIDKSSKINLLIETMNI